MSKELKFAAHHDRLGNIAWLARFFDIAIGRTAKILPTEPDFLKAQDKMVASYRFDAEEIKRGLEKWIKPTEDSRTLVYSLCVVMLVTQVEVFSPFKLVGRFLDFSAI